MSQEEVAEAPLRVRIGVPDDVHGVMQLAMLATDENGVGNADQMLILQQVWAALNREQGLIGIIGEPGAQIEAGVLLRVGPLWYSHDPVLEEKVIFVHPDYRAAKGGRASRLCEWSKEVAEMMGIPLMIGVLSNERTQAKVRMYKRQLGEPTGAYWIYNGHTGHPSEGDA